MADIALLFIEIWWKGGLGVFVAYGIYVATDNYSRDGILEISFVAVFWPFVILFKIYEWLRYYR